MAVLKMLYKTGRAGSFVVLSINEEACEGEWLDELPLFSFLTTTANAWHKATSIEEKVMWSNQLGHGVRVFLSGKAPTSKEESLDFEEWEYTDDRVELDLDLLTLESIENIEN